MSDDTVKIEVDGEIVEARKGQMLIEATDAVGAYIPRFCYHEKLSVAANCRMCLVEVEKAPKPLPACATPVVDGMKVFTKSPRAISAQKATMEFLLINHPLDCPICDQGGECELQDLAMGYGRDISRYNDRKRVVKDKDIGPLVSTDMTRCIHCTRCVRFGQEIAGQQELGTIGRAENMKISTYIEKSIDHELSANIIDLCPVGALNNKPYRYSARAWEIVQRPTVSAHDCVGSNLNAHVLRGTVKRIVPRENEAINETWISDRDRFSYEGIYSTDRLLTPKMKVDGEWRDVGWEEALTHLSSAVQESSIGNLGFLSSPSATLEEAHLLAQLARHVGSSNIDHRLRRRDNSGQDAEPDFPWLGCDIAELESRDAILVVGSDVRREAPIIAHRIRKAALAGASISFVNEDEYEYRFEVSNHIADQDVVAQLAGIVVAAGSEVPASVKSLCDGVKPTAEQKQIAKTLTGGDNGLVLLGQVADRHREAGPIRALSAAIAELSGASLGQLSEGANSAGAHLAGLLPHRGQGGEPRTHVGKSAGEMLQEALDIVVLHGVEPSEDLANGREAVRQLAGQKLVVALTPFAAESLLECADLLLPIGTFAETSGTFVNCEGRWQSFAGVANPVGEARPAWKVLRVLGNLLQVDGFVYETSEDVRDDLKAALGDSKPDNNYKANGTVRRSGNGGGDTASPEVPMYSVDATVRRATALQLTPEALRSRGMTR